MYTGVCHRCVSTCVPAAWSRWSHQFFLSLPPRCEGDGAGPAGLPAGASALRPSAGARAHTHPVPVRLADVLWHGLPGAEEVHPPGPGSQVRRDAASAGTQNLACVSCFPWKNGYFPVLRCWCVRRTSPSPPPRRLRASTGRLWPKSGNESLVVLASWAGWSEVLPSVAVFVSLLTRLEGSGRH